ncbi:MAG: 2'-5' RNA ligase family protein [Planctomycetes bacterium]|nr:2'-5' RNA ligase family protein [Planctomycetota bacterium]
MQTTTRSALAVLPPRETWEPIQAIRRVHDRKIGRWMPHINLLYPFIPAERFDEAAPRLAEACAKVAPFETTLVEFRRFAHSSGSATTWLAPEPKPAFVALQAILEACFPFCSDISSRQPSGYIPHLSVGQAASTEEARRITASLQRAWEPLRFRVDAVALLRRGPATPFEVDRWIRLGS